MTALKKYVTLESNSNTCVVLKVKPNSKLGLIKLGFFNGDEEYFRITKEIYNNRIMSCTVFYKDRPSFTWTWGWAETCVDQLTTLAGYLIHQCIEEDFKIECTIKNSSLKHYLTYPNLGK